MTSTSESVHVVVGWNDDYEHAYVHEAAAGEADDTGGVYEADVPAELWTRYDEASTAYAAAERAVIAAAGFDEEHGRMARCCPQWQGDVLEAREWWNVVLERSGDEKTWPVVDASIAHEATAEAARARIASFPERFFAFPGAGRVIEVERARLSIQRSGFGASVSNCRRCGWSRDEHGDAS